MKSRFGGMLGIGVATAMVLFAPAGANAATTIGQTFTPTDGCSAGITNLQTTSPGGSYTAPSDGVITSWSFQADSTGMPNIIKFKVARSAGGTQYTDVGQSPLVNMVPGALNTFLIRIPVRSGDLIGFYKSSGTAGCSKPTAGHFVHYLTGDSGPAPSPFIPFASPAQIDLSATLERDCDKDGFGDETQQAGALSCAALRAAALKKCKKKKSKKARKKCRRNVNALPK